MLSKKRDRIWNMVRRFDVFGLQQFSVLRRALFLSFGTLLRNDVGQVAVRVGVLEEKQNGEGWE